jgi:hypothetical protein
VGVSCRRSDVRRRIDAELYSGYIWMDDGCGAWCRLFMASVKRLYIAQDPRKTKN